MADPIEPIEPTLETVEPYVAQPAFTPTTPAAATPYAVPETYKPAQEDTVAGQMTGLLADNSKYIQNARKSGEEYANTKGLLNSSIGAKASESAAIEAALPIAQQDSSTAVDAGMQTNQGEIQAGLANQSYGNQANIVNTQGDVSSQLDAQTATQNAAINQIQNDFNAQIQGMQLTSEEVKAIGSSVTLMGQTLAEQVQAVQSDATMNADAKTALVDQLTQLYQTNVNSVAAIYDVPIEWDTAA